jgi:hypothetical protein
VRSSSWFCHSSEITSTSASLTRFIRIGVADRKAVDAGLERREPLLELIGDVSEANDDFLVRRDHGALHSPKLVHIAGGSGDFVDKRKTMSNPAFEFDHVHIISQDPEASANWYVEMFGATITATTMARGAPQIFVDLGGMTVLIRGLCPGEAPVARQADPAIRRLFQP